MCFLMPHPNYTIVATRYHKLGQSIIIDDDAAARATFVAQTAIIRYINNIMMVLVFKGIPMHTTKMRMMVNDCGKLTKKNKELT